MEVIITIILIYGGFWLISNILIAGGRAVKSTYQTAAHGGTFSDNFSDNFRINIELKDEMYHIYVEGRLPDFNGNSALKIKAFDCPGKHSSNDDLKQIFSMVQDHNNEEGFWGRSVPIKNDLSGSIITKYLIDIFQPELLFAHKSGIRTIKFRCTYLNSNKWYFLGGEEGKNKVINMPHGFQDYIDNGKKTNELFINIGMAVVFADGSADKKESAILKDYATQLSGGNEETKKEINNYLGFALYEYKKSGNKEREELFSKQLKEFEEVAIDSYKYKLADFTYAIMSADSEAHENELNYLEKIESTLSIDKSYFKKLADRSLVNLDASSIESNIEKIIGIDKTWPKDKICSHITSDFQKWSNRLNHIEDEEKKQKAQNMLDLLAKARQKYEC